MSTRRCLWITACCSALLAGAAPAQESDLSAPCQRPEVASSRDFCIAVAQTVASAQPQLGILLAAGNPTPGTAGSDGLRLLGLPAVSVGVKVNGVLARLPDVIESDGRSGTVGEFEIVAPALSGVATVQLFPGFAASPAVRGIGALDLIGTLTWLPFDAVGSDRFVRGSEFSYGIGARLGVLREGFTTPAVSLSVIRRDLGEVAAGSVCRRDDELATFVDSDDEFDFELGSCAGSGDPAEYGFGLVDWSGRAAVSKHLLGLGLAAGVGYDAFRSDLRFGLEADCPSGVPGRCFARVSGLRAEADRWSAFGNASFSATVFSVTAEVGWMQGDDPVTDFDEARAQFDAGQGTWFGSVGLRVAL
ncbi:hypothetical protein BH23GEM4_BH23GEM4_03480 [soil metagenome]